MIVVEHRPKTCETCGTTFAPTRPTATKDWSRRRFCSPQCVRCSGRGSTPKRDLGSADPRVLSGVRPCRGADLYPMDGERARDAEERLRPLALLLCGDCSIRRACAREGAKGEQGVWGGVLYFPGHDPIDLLASREVAV